MTPFAKTNQFLGYNSLPEKGSLAVYLPINFFLPIEYEQVSPTIIHAGRWRVDFHSVIQPLQSIPSGSDVVG
ncbi:MAG: hypothetical protein AAF399_28075 [Bacteroidota bacterium]